jgi:L-fuculose-phosphate aldolase
MTDIARSVVAVAQKMERAGLVVGTAGNVSGRLANGTICLTPSSVRYGDITVDGLAVCEVDGTHVAGSGKPSSEKAMHLSCYEAFPEVGGVVHCHPRYGSMFAVAHEPVPAVIEEVIIYVGGEVPVAEYATTGTAELAAEVVRHLATRSAVLMANHGLLCVGRSPADALHTALAVEQAAHIVHGARVLGRVVPLPVEISERFGEYYGLIRNGWSSDAG